MKILRPGTVGGLSVAAMLTAALIGIFFFAWRATGLPFVPFDTVRGRQARDHPRSRCERRLRNSSGAFRNSQAVADVNRVIGQH